MMYSHSVHNLHICVCVARVTRIAPKCAFCVFLGYPPKTSLFGPFLGVPSRTPKTCSRGAQLYGDTRRIIYCLDTRYGTQKGVFDPKTGFLDPSRPERENGVFGVFWGTPQNTHFVSQNGVTKTRDCKSPVNHVGIQRISGNRDMMNDAGEYAKDSIS
jgi:hypothetical protein